MLLTSLFLDTSRLRCTPRSMGKATRLVNSRTVSDVALHGYGVEPAVEFVGNLAEGVDLAKAGLLMQTQRSAGLGIDVSDHDMHAERRGTWKQRLDQCPSDTLAAPVR